MFSGGYGSGYGWINPIFFTGGIMALTSGHIYVGDVTNVAQDVQGFVTVLGANGSATPAAGYIGEQITNTAGATALTGSYVNISSVTLTAGVWLCSGTMNNDGGGTATGVYSQFWVKNANTSTLAFDWIQTDVSATSRTTHTFAPRVVVVASGDANKTVAIRCRSATANEGCEAHVCCVRIA